MMEMEQISEMLDFCCRLNGWWLEKSKLLSVAMKKSKSYILLVCLILPDTAVTP
jgi:hypothetical protein